MKKNYQPPMAQILVLESECLIAGSVGGTGSDFPIIGPGDPLEEDHYEMNTNAEDVSNYWEE